MSPVQRDLSQLTLSASASDARDLTPSAASRLSGSPSARSRTASLVRHVGELLADESHDVRHVAVRDLPPEPLLSADAAHPAIREVIDAIAWADALVVGTPVYKAAYSGLLKTLLDLMPQFALAGKRSFRWRLAAAPRMSWPSTTRCGPS